MLCTSGLLQPQPPAAHALQPPSACMQWIAGQHSFMPGPSHIMPCRCWSTHFCRLKRMRCENACLMPPRSRLSFILDTSIESTRKLSLLGLVGDPQHGTSLAVVWCIFLSIPSSYSAYAHACMSFGPSNMLGCTWRAHACWWRVRL